MQQGIAWGVALVLASIVGFAAGNTNGRSIERDAIANDCRQAGGFSTARTGYRCEVIR